MTRTTASARRSIVGRVAELQAAGAQDPGEQLLGAVLHERHPAGGDRIERRPVRVEDARPQARVREREAQRQADVAAAAEHDDVEAAVGSPVHVHDHPPGGLASSVLHGADSSKWLSPSAAGEKYHAATSRAAPAVSAGRRRKPQAQVPQACRRPVPSRSPEPRDHRDHHQGDVLERVEDAATALPVGDRRDPVGQEQRSGRVRTASSSRATHQPRLRTPISANGRSDGLRRTSAPGHPHLRPAATAATIQIVGVPRTSSYGDSGNARHAARKATPPWTASTST